MADVSQLRSRTRKLNRGQLILITGLLLAIVLVAMVLLLNAGIYTENLGTRTIDGDGGEAIQYQNEVRAGAAAVILSEDREEYEDYDPDALDEMQIEMDALDQQLSRQYAESGTIAEIDTTESGIEEAAIEGRHIRQTDQNREFISAEGLVSSPTIALDVNDEAIRTYDLTVYDLDEDNPNSPQTDTFHVLVDGGEEWLLYVYDDGADIVLAVDDGSGPTQLNCGDGTLPMQIDLLEGSVDGDDCDGLSWAENIDGSYDIGYQNGDHAEGTYSKTIAGDDSNVATEAEGIFGSDQPFDLDAVYGLELDIHYQTSEITYESTVRVAPGEPE